MEGIEVDWKIVYWVLNKKIKLRCSKTGKEYTLPFLFDAGMKTVCGLHTEIVRIRQVAHLRACACV